MVAHKKRHADFGDPPYEIFKSLLKRGRFEFSHTEEDMHTIDEPHGLKAYLERKLAFDNRLRKQFLEGFEELLSSDVTFRKAMRPTQTHSLDERQRANDSLVRILLSTGCLQAEICTLLLEKLPEYMGDEQSDRQTMPKLILNQLRWLESIGDTKSLTNKLLEILRLCPVNIQEDIIGSIAEIIPDDHHDLVATSLESLMFESSELTLCVLDTCANLNLKDTGYYTNLHNKAREMLKNVQTTDLPVLVRFLLKNAREHDMETLTCIRKSVQLEQEEPQNESTDRSWVVLIVGELSRCFRGNRGLIASYFKVLQAVKEPREHRMIDLLILLVIHKINALSSNKADQILKKKVTHKLINADLAKQFISKFPEATKLLFGHILTLCTHLFRGNAVTRAFTVEVYHSLFTQFTDNLFQQDVMGAILTHVGSGQPSEKSAALRLLTRLSKENLQAVQRFGTLIKGLWDYLSFQSYETEQIRQLMDIFSCLKIDNKNFSVDDEFEIVIQKMLHHPQSDFQKIGIIGHISVLKTLTLLESKNMGLKREKLEENLNRLWKHACHNLSSHYFLMDELTGLVSNPKITDARENLVLIELIHEETRNFTQLFLETNGKGILTQEPVDIKERLERMGTLIKVRFGLVNPKGGAFQILNVLGSLLGTSGVSRHQKEQLICLFPKFRLFALCERLLQGNLSECRSILCSPVMLYDNWVLQENGIVLKPSDHQILIDAMFVSVNWLRELLNAFPLTDSSMKNKKEFPGRLCARLRQIVQLETEIFDEVQNNLPTYVPSCRPITTNAKRMAARRAQEQDEDSKEEIGDTMEVSERKPKRKAKRSSKKSDASMVLENVKPYWRELGVETLALLQFPLEMDDDVNEVSEKESLNPWTLLFLLTDFGMKLKDVFAAGAPKSFFASKKQLSSVMVRYTSYSLTKVTLPLFAHLHNHIAQIAALLDPDGMECTLDFEVEGVLIDCVDQYLNVVKTLVKAEDDFQREKEQKVLSKGLMYLAKGELSKPKIAPAMEESCITLFKFLQRLLSAIFNGRNPKLLLCVNIVQLLDKLIKFSAFKKSNNQVDLSYTLIKLCAMLLKREWANATHLKSSTVAEVVKIYVSQETSRKCLFNLAMHVIPAHAAGEEHEFLPTLTKRTVVYWFKPVITEITNHFSNQKVSSRNLPTVIEIAEGFSKLCQFASTNTKSAPLHAAAVRLGKTFLESVNRKLTTQISPLFQSNRGLVEEFINSIQTAAQSLQKICSLAKGSRSTLVTASIPALKKAIEAFIYQTKQVFLSNKALGRFAICRSGVMDSDEESSVEEDSEMES